MFWHFNAQEQKKKKKKKKKKKVDLGEDLFVRIR